MADQIIDKVDVGIPLDVEVAVSQARSAATSAERSARDAGSYASDASDSADQAAGSASLSADYARQAQEYSQSRAGIVVSPGEPDGLTAGGIWFETDDETERNVVGIHMRGTASDALYPSSSTYPSLSSYPGAGTGGDVWIDLTIAQALVKS